MPNGKGMTPTLAFLRYDLYALMILSSLTCPYNTHLGAVTQLVARCLTAGAV